MTETTTDPSRLVQKHDQGDFPRAVAEAVLLRLTEADVDGVIGAGMHERADGRTTRRNGYRERSLDTRPDTLLGTRPDTLNLKVPEQRLGRYFPWLLFPLVSISPGFWGGANHPGRPWSR